MTNRTRLQPSGQFGPERRRPTVESDLRIVAGLDPAPPRVREAAEGRLYRLSVVWATLYLRRIGRRNAEEAATEAVHEWWLVLRSLAAKCWDGKPFAPLAFVVLRRTAGRVTSPGSRKRVAFDGLDREDEGLDVRSGIERQETCRAVRTAVLALAKKYREVLLLKYEAGLAAHEIARLLGVAESTVHVRVFRGRELLRKALRNLEF